MFDGKEGKNNIGFKRNLYGVTNVLLRVDFIGVIWHISRTVYVCIEIMSCASFINQQFHMRNVCLFMCHHHTIHSRERPDRDKKRERERDLLKKIAIHL